MRSFILPVLIFLSVTCAGSDTLYARKVIKYLTSEKCYGRGYLKNGLKHAEKFIVSEIRKTNAEPGFAKKFTKAFTHPVNIFPSACKVKLNGIQLEAGKDFIVDPASSPAHGIFKLLKKDSVTFISEDKKLVMSLRKKLTFSVASQQSGVTEVEALISDKTTKASELEIDLDSRVNTKFKSNNISCVFQSTSKNDTMIVFTAHYDHLGGMGKKIWFPGANDNASGVSVLLNLIRYYDKNPPRYKTVFIFFAGEEAGLLGSKDYVTTPPVDLSRIKFLINLDLLGTGDDGIMVVNGALHEKEFNRLNEINSAKSLVNTIRKRGKAANSDHYWFSEKGVPAFFIYTMGGRSAYHDVYDIADGLPLTDYVDVFKLITEFASSF